MVLWIDRYQQEHARLAEKVTAFPTVQDRKALSIGESF